MKTIIIGAKTKLLSDLFLLLNHTHWNLLPLLGPDPSSWLYNWPPQGHMGRSMLHHHYHRLWLGDIFDSQTLNSHHCLQKVTLRGVAWKSGPGVESSNLSANIGPTETYYIPNQWKLNKVFYELCRFEIAALIEWDNQV